MEAQPLVRTGRTLVLATGGETDRDYRSFVRSKQDHVADSRNLAFS